MINYIINQFENKPFGGWIGLTIVLIASILNALFK
jgi:hypothetical protein